MRKKLIDTGIKHLKEFGYPDVDSANILTDYVYRQLFKNMLEGTYEDLVAALENNVGNLAAVKACKDLIEEIDSAKGKALVSQPKAPAGRET